MPSPLAILQHSPWWVYVLFAVLIWFGLRALRPRTLPIWRLMIVPAVFIGWGIASMLTQSRTSVFLIAVWLVTATVGAILAWIGARRLEVRIDRAHRSVTLPGSVRPLVVNMLIFAAKYAIGVAMVLSPRYFEELTNFNIGISGAMAGYFIGWLGRLILAYRSESEADIEKLECSSDQVSPVVGR